MLSLLRRRNQPRNRQKKTASEPADQEEIQWDAIKDLKVKVPMKNGDKEWIEEKTFEDLRNQRMMHADYMARRREFDEQSKSQESKIKETVEKERNQYLGALNVLHQTVMQVAEQELANVDWAKLAQEEPAKYVQLQARAQTAQRPCKGSLRARQGSETAGRGAEKRPRPSVSESRTKLKEAIPSWNDSLYQSLLKSEP
jgi:hypothetical protein